MTEVKRLVDSVSVASGQQAHGIEQVLQGIRQMEKVTQTTAATAEESAAASEQLSAQAGMTMRLVERLESMVGHVDRRSGAGATRRAGARHRTHRDGAGCRRAAAPAHDVDGRSDGVSGGRDLRPVLTFSERR